MARQQLLERMTAGIHVEIDYDPETDQLHLTVEEGIDGGLQKREECILQDRSKVRDAFEHPYIYLAQLGSITKSSETESEEYSVKVPFDQENPPEEGLQNA